MLILKGAEKWDFWNMCREPSKLLFGASWYECWLGQVTRGQCCEKIFWSFSAPPTLSEGAEDHRAANGEGGWKAWNGNFFVCREVCAIHSKWIECQTKSLSKMGSEKLSFLDLLLWSRCAVHWRHVGTWAGRPTNQFPQLADTRGPFSHQVSLNDTEL